MPRRRRTPVANPFLLWSDLALRTTEMMLASAQVIGHRTQRIAAAGSRPGARDRREFARMGQEKVEAGLLSATAMTADAVKLNQQMMKAGMETAQAMWSLATSRTVFGSLGQQTRLAQSLARSGTQAFDMGNTVARMAAKGLTPVHSRATANAKRLGRSRKK
jgi:hypothetical protein